MKKHSHSNIRALRWFIVTYNTPEEFAPVLEKCVHYAYIKHYLDDCEPHYHLLCIFPNQRTLSAIKKDIVGEQNTFGEKVIDTIACFKYLTHEDSDKARYPITDIVSDNLEYFCSLSDDADQPEISSMIDDIISGCSLRTLAVRYGRDFVKNSQRYIDYAYAVFRQEREGAKMDYQKWQVFGESVKVLESNMQEMHRVQSSLFEHVDSSLSTKIKHKD